MVVPQPDAVLAGIISAGIRRLSQMPGHPFPNPQSHVVMKHPPQSESAYDPDVFTAVIVGTQTNGLKMIRLCEAVRAGLEFKLSVGLQF